MYFDRLARITVVLTISVILFLMPVLHQSEATAGARGSPEPLTPAELVRATVSNEFQPHNGWWDLLCLTIFVPVILPRARLRNPARARAIYAGGSAALLIGAAYFILLAGEHAMCHFIAFCESEFYGTPTAWSAVILIWQLGWAIAAASLVLPAGGRRGKYDKQLRRIAYFAFFTSLISLGARIALLLPHDSLLPDNRAMPTDFFIFPERILSSVILMIEIQVFGMSNTISMLHIVIWFALTLPIIVATLIPVLLLRTAERGAVKRLAAGVFLAGAAPFSGSFVATMTSAMWWLLFARPAPVLEVIDATCSVAVFLWLEIFALTEIVSVCKARPPARSHTSDMSSG